MRKLTILLFVLFAIGNMQAQSEVMEYKPLKDFDFRVADYIKYNFEERKAAYIGKPLSELLKDCEVTIKSRLGRGYTRVAGDYGTSFYFENYDIRQYRRKYDKGGYDMPEIRVHWRDTIFCPFRGRFRDEMLAWYSEQIVADIKTFGKNFSELPPVPSFEEEVPSPTPSSTPEEVSVMSSNAANLTDSVNFKVIFPNEGIVHNKDFIYANLEISNNSMTDLRLVFKYEVGTGKGGVTFNDESYFEMKVHHLKSDKFFSHFETIFPNDVFRSRTLRSLHANSTIEIPIELNRQYFDSMQYKVLSVSLNLSYIQGSDLSSGFSVGEFRNVEFVMPNPPTPDVFHSR